MALPRLAASGAMSVRTQSAIRDAMAQRRIAAGFTATCRLSGSTTASSRTRSSPPQPPAPWMSGMLGAMAIASVSASRQAEGGGGGWRPARPAGRALACSAACRSGAALPLRRAGPLLGLDSRRLGRARLRQRHRCRQQRLPAQSSAWFPRTGRPMGESDLRRRSGRSDGTQDHQQHRRGGNHCRLPRLRADKAICGLLSPR